jgi:hypothetical protein
VKDSNASTAQRDARDARYTENIQRYRSRANTALGIALLALVFLAESAVAHHVAPNAASPLLWTVLGAVILGALGYAMWAKRRANGPRH